MPNLVCWKEEFRNIQGKLVDKRLLNYLIVDLVSIIQLNLKLKCVFINNASTLSK